MTAQAGEGRPNWALQFIRVLRLKPRVAGYLSDRGTAHRSAGRLNAAISDFTQAIQAEKRFPIPYNNRADAYLATGALDLAIRDLNQALKLDPGFAVAYVNRATANAMLGQHDRIQRDVDAAVSLGIDRQALEDMLKEIRPRRRQKA